MGLDALRSQRDLFQAIAESAYVNVMNADDNRFVRRRFEKELREASADLQFVRLVLAVTHRRIKRQI